MEKLVFWAFMIMAGFGSLVKPLTNGMQAMAGVYSFTIYKVALTATYGKSDEGTQVLLKAGMFF